MRSASLILITLLWLSTAAFAQRPGPGGGPPEWARIVDVNRNGRIEQEEFRAAADAFFLKNDRNNNGILERSELPIRRGPGGPGGPVEPNRAPLPSEAVPPFLFLERGEADLTKAAFDERANLRFIVIDANSDRAIDWQEIKMVRPPEPPPRDNVAMAQFVGAEMRFGDKQVKGAPFSAETVREESKRLFDGSLVKSRSTGLIYRDGQGRVRQEMPFETIAGFPVVGRNDAPLKLVHIVDHVAGKTFSLNPTGKTYFNIPFKQASPLAPKNEPEDAKTESLGKQTIEGIAADGTRTTIEIPVGKIGNDKPILVVTEKWFSPELQMVIMSRHTDPFIGEVTFRIVNIKLGEPSAELFKVPADYKQSEIRPPAPSDGRRPMPGDRRPPVRPMD